MSRENSAVRVLVADVTRLLDGDMKDEKNSRGWTYVEELARQMLLHPKSAAELTAKAYAKGCLKPEPGVAPKVSWSPGG
jgi:hypothetical protein